MAQAKSTKRNAVTGTPLRFARLLVVLGFFVVQSDWFRQFAGAITVSGSLS
jgi:hypothetical protein